MNESERLSDLLIQEEPERFLQKISINASQSTLWNRTPLGKAIAIRSSSMIPQFKVSSEALDVMWTVGSGVDARNQLIGFLVGHKYSPKHYLSVKLAECQWHISRAARPQGDYTIQLFPKRLETPSADSLDLDNHEVQALLASVQASLDSTRDDVSLEPLDVCKALIAFSIDRTNQMLYMKCELVHPSVSLHFTPITPLKLVSSPLSAQLIQEVKGRKGKFQTGFLTLDQSKRVLPMLITDPMAYKCVLVGMWVSGIPVPSQLPDNGRYNALTHPLVWSAAIRYLQSSTIKDRVSPSPEQNTFLFVHFSANTKFYEVSSMDEAVWKTVESCHEIARDEEGYLQAALISFLRDGNTSIVSNVTSGYESSFNTSFANPLIASEDRPQASTTPVPIPVPLARQSSQDSAGSVRSSRVKPPKPEPVEASSDSGLKSSLQEQEKVLRRIQQQISELQEHMLKYQAYMTPPVAPIAPVEKHFASTCVNTSIYRPPSPKRQYVPLRFATTGTNTSFNLEPKAEAEMAKTVKRTGESIPRDDDLSYNPMRYSSSSANITLDQPQISTGTDAFSPVAVADPVLQHSFPRQMKDMSVASSIDGLSQISLPSVKLQKSQSTVMPTPILKKPREHVIEGQTGGDATITIPKIAYSNEDFGSDDDEEEDEEVVAKVQRKYLRK